LRGLGEKLSDIERLIADDAESLVRLRELVVAGKGGNNGNQYTKAESGNADNISIATDLFTEPESRKKKADAGTSRAYTLCRLKNERKKTARMDRKHTERGTTMNALLYFMAQTFTMLAKV